MLNCAQCFYSVTFLFVTSATKSTVHGDEPQAESKWSDISAHNRDIISSLPKLTLSRYYSKHSTKIFFVTYHGDELQADSKWSGISEHNRNIISSWPKLTLSCFSGEQISNQFVK